MTYPYDRRVRNAHIRTDKKRRSTDADVTIVDNYEAIPTLGELAFQYLSAPVMMKTINNAIQKHGRDARALVIRGKPSLHKRSNISRQAHALGAHVVEIFIGAHMSEHVGDYTNVVVLTRNKSVDNASFRAIVLREELALYTKLLALAKDLKDGHAREAWTKFYQSKISLTLPELESMLSEQQMKSITRDLQQAA